MRHLAGVLVLRHGGIKAAASSEGVPLCVFESILGAKVARPDGRTTPGQRMAELLFLSPSAAKAELLSLITYTPECSHVRSHFTCCSDADSSGKTDSS
jgi:hypothetical protein